MNQVMWVLALVIGVGVWGLLLFKAASLVPFAVDNMRARRARVEAATKESEASQKRLVEVQQSIDRALAEARAQGEEIIARARAEADAVAAELRERGENDARMLLERARADIGVERDRAIQDLRRETADRVVDVAGRAISQALDDPSHRALIDQSLQSLQGGR